MFDGLKRLAERVLRPPQTSDPECACCVRGLFVGSHTCPESVVVARQARAALAELEAGHRAVV